MSEHEDDKQADEIPELNDELASWPFKVGGKRYTAYEMWAPDRDKYLNHIKRRSDENGNVRSMEGFQMDLILRCVLDADEKPVTKEVVVRWPASTQAKVFWKCQELSCLTKESVEKAKND